MTAERTGNHKAALADAERALKQAPTNQAAMFVAGQAACHLKNAAKAKEMIAKLPPKGPAANGLHKLCEQEGVALE
jgi:hypothetical protein